MEGLNTTTKTWTGSASEITFTGSGTNKWDKLTITYTTGGSQTTYYTVTYHANVTGVDDEEDTYAEGTTVTLRPANTFTNEGYTFSEWNTQADGEGDGYDAGDQIEGIDDDLEFYAIWMENTPSDEQWVLTSLADLTEGDVFVIVGNNGSNYAMANDNGTSGAPAAVAVTVANDAITGTVAENIQWNIAGNATDGYTFYPNGTTATWLYCYNNNNGLRVGTGDDYAFVMNSNYLYNSGQGRYIGIYNSQNWRSYTSINSNIQGQTFAFYKKVTGGVTYPSISAENVSVEYNATSGNITYTINNPVDNGTLTAATTSEWLTIGTVGETVPFTCTANEAATERTATVILTYAYGENQTATKNVTVTQAGNPNYTMTIAEVRAQGTGSVVTRGIVTSCVGTTGYIQDATAAICVYGTALTVGDEIRVSGTLSNYNGLLEITNPTVTVLSSGNIVNPELMTVADVVASTNQGWYIRVEEAAVSAINDKNVTIAQGESTITVRFASTDDITFEANDVISLNGNIGCYNTTQIANPQNVEVQEAAELTITPATVSIPQTGHVSGNFEVSTNITGVYGGYVYYYNPDDLETPIDEPEWVTINYDSEALTVSYVSTVVNDTYEARTVCFKYFAMCAQGVVASNVVTVTQEGMLLPSITINPLAYTFNADAHVGTINVVYENVDTEAGVDIYWYKADGETSATYDWITADFDDNNNVEYIIDANNGEARTAYFKVYSLDADFNDVWSGLVTITQAEYVVDYATLPFEFDGGRNDIATTVGLTQENLGTDYNASPKLKFEKGNKGGDGVYSTLVLKFNERPGTLTFDIKGNGFSDGTFTVQTSVDGVTYTDLATYTELGNTQSEEFTDLGENVRYIKWIYTEKVNGNVALGNINLAAYDAVPSITVDPATVNVDADEHDGTLGLTYEYLEITDPSDFGVQYYDAEGEETEEPGWIEVLVAEQDATVGEGYVVSYYMVENEGTEARTAYFKVFAMDDETELVYSNLVTVTQAAPVAPFTGATYTLATTIESGRRYIITNGSDRAMGGQNTNNRAAKEIVIVENVAQVDSDEVVEFVINGPDANGFYTIYDANVPGYLYAAGGTSNNHLKTETFCNNKGQWTITFEDNAASIVANVSGRNKMQYNSSSNIFSCYTGGQDPVYLYLKDEEEPTYTFYKDIKGYTGNGGYYLIASPVAENVTPSEENGIINGTIGENNNTYDLYWFNQTQEDEWQNYEAGQFDLVNGMGYLYANSEDVTLIFNGAPSTNGTVSLVKDDDVDWPGWNLVGNPFSTVAYTNREHYVMAADGSEIIAGESNAINPMEGLFVIATSDGEEMTFSTEAPNPGGGGNGGGFEWKIVMDVNRGSDHVIDRAIVRFGEGSMLPKFQLRKNSTKIYITEGNQDYAVVRSANQGEMPVSFKAEENGNYTINVKADDVAMNYLHLIDNMTGADVDLLQTPSYTFVANTTDYATRFKLVFSAANVEEYTSSSFAFFNGSTWTISNTGEATLQVVDVMGHVLSTETINGNADMNIDAVPGIYMLRLVNGNDVKVQKVVVK